MTLTKDELNKLIDSLPQDVQDAFFSDSVSQSILDIGKKYGLTVDKIGELGGEVSNVMFGITPTTDFIKNLSDRLGVDKEKAKNIAEDVNQKIFQSIRASLRKIHGLPDEAPPPSIPPQTPPYKGGDEKNPASPVIIGGTTMAFTNPVPPKTPLPAKNEEIKEVEAMPPIFAKKITPIDALLDKIDAGESVIKPKTKIENVPPITSEPSGGIRTMFQDAKSFLKAKMPPAAVSEKPAIPPSAPVSLTIKSPTPPPPTSPSASQGTAPTPPPATDPLPARQLAGGLTKEGEGEVKFSPPITPPTAPQKQSPELSHDSVKSNIESVLGSKIKVGDNSATDPYREPIE